MEGRSFEAGGFGKMGLEGFGAFTRLGNALKGRGNTVVAVGEVTVSLVSGELTLMSTIESEEEVLGVCVSPDGTSVGLVRERCVVLYDVFRGDRLRRRSRLALYFEPKAVAMGGEFMCVAGSDGVHIFRVPSGGGAEGGKSVEQVRILRGTESYICCCVDIASDASLIAVSTNDGLVGMWRKVDASDWKSVMSIRSAYGQGKTVSDENQANPSPPPPEPPKEKGKTGSGVRALSMGLRPVIFMRQNMRYRQTLDEGDKKAYD